jgi:hypothetical protein
MIFYRIHVSRGTWRMRVCLALSIIIPQIFLSAIVRDRAAIRPLVYMNVFRVVLLLHNPVIVFFNKFFRIRICSFCKMHFLNTN